MNSLSTWSSLIQHDRLDQVTDSCIKSVISGQFAAIVIDDVYSASERSRISQELDNLKRDMATYCQANLRARVLGNPLNWRGKSKTEYFANVKSAFEAANGVFLRAKCDSPLKTTLQALGRAWQAGAEIAKNHNGLSYFAGDLREIQEAPLHNDFVRRLYDHPEFARLKEQLSWNIYLSASTCIGGELEIFNRRWSETDAAYKYGEREKMGYKPEVVSNIESVQIAPTPGRFVLFRSTNYHRVLRSFGTRRMSMTSFVGVRRSSDPLVLWS